MERVARGLRLRGPPGASGESAGHLQARRVPSATLDAYRADRFVVVWQSYQDGTGQEIQGRRFDGAATPLGDEFQVNTFTSGDQEAPAIAADEDGNFVVVWDSYGVAPPTRDANGILGQHFASSGEPLGDEFQVNMTTAGPQFGPAVSATPDGDFVVAWTSGYTYGASNGLDVFAQRLRTTAFAPPVLAAATRFVLRENTANPRRRRLTLRATIPRSVWASARAAATTRRCRAGNCACGARSSTTRTACRRRDGSASGRRAPAGGGRIATPPCSRDPSSAWRCGRAASG